ncbi:LPXTG cell wall anchor domain-containing protein [Limosilactobacillus reuteri]|uniref:KxYKxGKxW signal peptide domain-containing protein n=1 Tax=Limosilactobacillus reuteri TaxID=1598 RepID=UPI001E5A905F|nr:LPXTG cell wall anchor domain-containing protein [Limosilactobacillus reuteri]MCC4436595.1 LPXTG cell wall anchor domain-containing protein [Limosilactobacillus reuteri]MCC4437714.1 LPXTG cell wall anchor domain-containing protein [Limosilactobacillus reuteri]MCC4441665.1 LPXTG cell wall anchor domain-containing protein [Limosilactobacillus reuteri]MCC4443671.1 LPXTG cell wall anchor domain-containing protein [Limosilactobacillus reuteri]MCC4445425.1 LPXTG cell wall anchor domain-containing
MENKVHYKLFKNGKFLCTMALSTVAVLTTLGATNIHADATPVQNSNEQSEQTSQSAYQQKASQNEQQLSDLAAANATKETNAANSYAQANQQSANTTSQQIADIQNQYAQKKQQAEQQIQAASDAMTSSVASQTQVVNNSAASATSATQQANAASEAQMQSANAAAIAQAQQQVQEAAAHSAAAISAANSNYQAAVDSANATHQLATSAANADYTANVNNENNTYSANQQQVKNDVTVAQNAVNQAQQNVKDHTTTQTVTVPGQKRTIDRITNAAENSTEFTGLTNWGTIPYMQASNFKNKTYYNTIMGMFPGQTPYNRDDAANHTGLYDFTHVPTNVSEMPTDFQPGLLIYNPDLDSSDVVSPDGFTEAQKQTLRAFMTSWANSFRNWIYNNDRDVWNEANKISEFKNQTPRELKFTTTMNDAGNKIGQMRTDAGLTNDQHTIPSSNPNTDYDKALPEIDNVGLQTGNYMIGSTQAEMENLMTVEPSIVANAKPTMLNYLISAYNMTQAMWYGEIYSDGLGGHARGILDNDLGYITGGFEKITPSTYSSKFTNNQMSSREKYLFDHNMPIYAFTYDAYGYVPYVSSFTDLSNVMTTLPNDQKVINKYNELQSTVNDAMGQEIQDPTFMSAVSYEKNGDGSHTETKQVTPQQYTDALNNAKSHLTQVTNDANSKLHQLTQTHQDHLKNLENIRDNAIKQADATLQKAVEQAKQTRDDKIAEANGSQVNVDALKKSLDEKYQQLVASDKAKLDKIETDRQNAIKQIKANAQSEYDAKLKALGVDDQAVQAQIKQLQNAHEAFVKENADKLAQLKAEDAKAYNDLKTKLDTELATLMPKHETNTDHSSDVINTGDHTIVLPSTDDEKNESATHNNASQSSDEKDTNLGKYQSQSGQSAIVSGKDNLSNKYTNSLTNSDTVVVKNGDIAHTSLNANNDTSVSASTTVDNNQVAVPVNSTNTEASANDSVQNEFAPESVTMTRKEYKQQTKKLPQTGNESSLAILLLGALATMFGVGLATKKKEY